MFFCLVGYGKLSSYMLNAALCSAFSCPSLTVKATSLICQRYCDIWFPTSYMYHKKLQNILPRPIFMKLY